ncbi:MAG: protein kinase [Myxococcales bacterium]|nr:protein kinase [Myxococcales bacterium]
MVHGGSEDDQAPAELGGWRLVELLGRGGMGEVWRAEREGPGGVRRRAALKRMLTRLRNDGELLQRFMAEARISSRLEHSNIVQVLDFGDQPEPYLVFEYVEGISASELLQESSRARIKLPAAAAAFVCAEVATGLDYAHRKRDEQGRPLEIVHRDVSPHNVLLSIEGAVKIADFGVARAADNTLRTRAGIQVGKLVYMAPEQAAGAPIDGRADVFSLGIVLWEMLTLQPLFPRDDAATTLQRLQTGDIPAPSKVEPKVPPALDQIVLTALSLYPEQRFASAGAFAQALRGFVHSVAPGFDSSELIRILHKIAPSVSWHVQTPPPADSARERAPVAPRVASPPMKAMPAMAMPAMAAPGAPPAAAPAPAPQPAAAPQPAPAAPMASAVASAPIAQVAPGAPQGQHVPAPSPFGNTAPGPSSPSWGTSAPPSPPKTSAGKIVLFVAIAVVGTVLLVGGIALALGAFSRRSSADVPSDSDAQRGPGSPVPATNSSVPPSDPSLTRTLPAVIGTNALAGEDDASTAPPVPAVDEDASAEQEPPSANPAAARAVGAIQRSLAQNEAQFVQCVSAPSGVRARVTLRVQYDGGARLVRLVEATSSQMSIDLAAQQCLKNTALRVVNPAGVAGSVTARWSFWVEPRAAVGLEGSAHRGDR